MTFNNTLHQQQNNDFQGLVDLLENSLFKDVSIKSREFEKVRPCHDRLFLLKYLIDLKSEFYFEESKDFFTASISSLIECLFQISLGRYRTTHILLRSSLEAVCSGIYIEQFASNPGEKFSNNLEKSIKRLVDVHAQGISKRQRKKFKSSVNLFVDHDIKKSLYWSLSDYVHSTKREYLSSEEYFEDMIQVNKKIDSDEFEKTISIFSDLLNSLIVLILISDYDFYFGEPRDSVRIAVSRLSVSQKNLLDEWHTLVK